MKYQFKAKPTKVCNDCTLATTPFGDVIIFKEKLIVPVNATDKLVYSFITEKWQSVCNGLVMPKSPTFITLFSDNLIVKSNSFFEYLITNNEEFIKTYYRTLREKICYPIVNRGKVWYDRLTLSQTGELNDWYEAWLDVTETLTIPKTPSWINDKLNKLEPEELL